MGYALFCLCVAVVLAVLMIVGDVAAVTVWFPHLRPTFLGYVVAYASLAGGNLVAWWFVIAGPLATALDG